MSTGRFACAVLVALLYGFMGSQAITALLVVSEASGIFAVALVLFAGAVVVALIVDSTSRILR